MGDGGSRKTGFVPGKPIDQQVVVVTGASAGLGRAVVRLAASRGAAVVAVARGADALDATVAELRALGARAEGVQADVASLDDCTRVVEVALDRFGRIDTFCANAMVTVYQEARDLEPEELRRVVDVNFLGAVNCYWASLPHLRVSRGGFVHVSSALAYRGIPLQAAYCSSKAAGRAFFETARVEHRKHRIPVDISLVLPGAINTPQFDTARQYIGKQPQPVPPIYEPEPFAQAVVHTFEHPVRELPVGWGAQKLLWGQKLSPRAGDLVLPPHGVGRPAHGRGQAGGLARQPLRAPPRRPGSPRPLLGALAREYGVDIPAAAPPAGRCRRRRVGVGYDGNHELARKTARFLGSSRHKRRTKEHMATLELKDLHVALEDGTEIVKGVDLKVSSGEVHAIMGPNGSGKSTLAYAIAGHPAYEITSGQILLDGVDITEAGADERAQAGLFLAFQYPHAIPGVTVTNFLRQAINAVRKARNGGVDDPMPVPEFRKAFLAKMDDLKVSRELASRYLNDGFSGGEKKRVEILQMAMLEPKIAVLDETDSGLDIDALKVVAEGVQQLVGPDMGALVITHYQRILNYIKPDFVHVFVGGKIVEEGGPELAEKLEVSGYEEWEKEEVAA